MSAQYTTVEQQVSYGIGRQMGEQLSNNEIEGLEIDAVLSGLADALNGLPSAVPHEQLEVAFQEISQRLRARQREKAELLAADGQKFLAENAKREGIVVTASGLQYEVLSSGSGESRHPVPSYARIIMEP